MLRRAERKLAEVQRWVDSVHSIGDWPAAITLGMLRTRPAVGNGFGARLLRAVFPQIWVRPAMLRGLAVRIDPSDLTQFEIYEELFIERIYDLGKVSFAPDTVIDCGAFEGYFSLLARARFANVPAVAFEPNPRNFEGLAANVAHNREAITIRAEAVSTSDGIARFSGEGCGGRLSDGQTGAIDVKVADLRRVINEMTPDRLLLKLDIEGEERRLLPALLPVLPRCCAIFFEWHQGRDEFQQAAALLASHGFAIEPTRENRVDDATVFIDAFAQRL